VAACPACGTENPVGAKFCNECAAPLTGDSREQRKTVTVLFCDVTGSTALGESTDPEALRALLARYFERMKAIVESHGGTVEKFIGDAVMAVFGVPVAHEDDALRACRAAVEMRDALPELGIRGRIGVNTGEVVTGTSERLATGDAVNVAARFEQAAEPGDVLIGEMTHALVRQAVRAEPVEPLTLKGKAEPVPAYRLVSVHGASERGHALRFVGREAELAQIVEGWDRAEAQARCELVTVVGDAGVGKSRLVAEALATVEPRVVRGRCLPYGEGITYWPVVEVVKQLAKLPSDPVAAAAISSLLGESEVGTTGDEIAWAFRKLLEEEAPLVVVFDDIQWGDETFLNLVESTALLSADAPLLLLCMARPELVDQRPGWPGTLRLQPLTPDDADALIGDGVAPELRERIAQAAAGNPLFISEMLAMAAENDEVEVPPTLKALLTARLDQLDEPERRVLERGSVEGEIFHRGSVQALAPEETQVTTRLAALVRHQLVRPDRAQLAGDDGYRFRHLLIRDTAYEALPKAVRADLHARFADWLDEHGREVVERDEIVGYHLEQAARYHAELGQPDSGLAGAASERLAAAGRRARWRLDRPAASSLFKRAVAICDPPDVHVLADLVHGLDDPREKARLMEAAVKRAEADGDVAAAALARTLAASARLQTVECSLDEMEAIAVAAIPLLEAAADHVGLAHVWDSLANLYQWRGRWEQAEQASEETLRHAGLAGWRQTYFWTLPAALYHGPRPAGEALEILDKLAVNYPRLRLNSDRAILLAMLDRLEEARDVRHVEARHGSLLAKNLPKTHCASGVAPDLQTQASHLQVF
jgi:class 3 adenylate cyclase